MGIFPTLYEEDDVEDDEDTNLSDPNLDILGMGTGGLEDYLNGRMGQLANAKKPQSSFEVNSQQPRAAVMASMSSPSAPSLVDQVMQEQKLLDATTCESDFGSGTHHDDEGDEAALVAQVIKEHSYAMIPQLGAVASMSKPPQSQTQQVQEQKLFDAIPKAESVVKQEPDVAPPVKAGSLPSGPDVKPVRNTPNLIDTTMAVSSNPELINLVNTFEEETNDNNLLVDWPSPIYIEDYKGLAEGKWLSNNVVDFYLQHLYYGLPADLQAEVFVFQTTFFSVLRDLGLGAVSSYFKDTNFFDKEHIN